MNRTEIQNLKEGDRFAVDALGIRGKLLRSSPGSAFVEIDRRKTVEFTTFDGKDVSFTGQKERGHWSLTTMVEPL